MNNIVVIYTDIEKKFTLFSKNSSIVTEIITTSTDKKFINFIQKEGNVFTTLNGKTTLLEENEMYIEKNYRFYVQKHSPKKCYSIEGVSLVTIQNTEFATIGIENFNGKVTIENKQDEVVIYPNDNVVYVNNSVIKEKTQINYGDVVDIVGCEFIFRKHTLEIVDGLDLIYNNKLFEVDEEVSLKGQLREYKRSPRIIHNQPDEDINISNPPSESKPEAGGLLKLIIPPLLTMTITVAMGILLKRGPYMYMMMATSGLAIIMSVFNYFFHTFLVND